MLEKGWLGSGNVGRNTTIVRSNYLLPGNIPFYEWSMKLWEGLEQDLNYNAMVSQRGVLNLYHSDAQRDAYARRGNAMRLHGVDAELLDREQVRAMLPYLDFDNARFPIQGGLLQRRGGTVRHDAVAWGYARAAERARRRHRAELRGDGHPHRGRARRRRRHGARASCAPARSGSPAPATPRASPRWRGCGCRSRATCCRPSCRRASSRSSTPVITFGAGHFYISQSDKGGLVFGGDIDGYNSYAQRGNLPAVEDVCESGMALMPMLGRLRLLRSWGGLMDMSHGRLADHRQDADRRASISTPAGATAASRRRRPRAGASPTPSPATSRTRSTRPSGSTASPPAT